MTHNFYTHPTYANCQKYTKMSKRAADQDENGGVSLKSFERPETGNGTLENEPGPFEDEYEDEFESEDEVMVAGEDGQPDDENSQIVEESGGM